MRSVVLLPPVKSVLTSVDTLTQRRGCCLVSASDDTISNACIDLCEILLAAHVMKGFFLLIKVVVMQRRPVVHHRACGNCRGRSTVRIVTSAVREHVALPLDAPSLCAEA